jgi:hypothetical protein
MAITTALVALSRKYKEALTGGKIRDTMYDWLVAHHAFDNGHTHTGSPDGAQLPAGALASGAINSAAMVAAGILTPTQLAAAAKTQVAVKTFLAAADAAGDLPNHMIFTAPVTLTISAIYFTPETAVVPAAANGVQLDALLYSTAGVLAGTYATLIGTAGTWTAYKAQTMGAITGGTMTVGQSLNLRKGTFGGGTPVGVSSASVVWLPS